MISRLISSILTKPQRIIPYNINIHHNTMSTTNTTTNTAKKVVVIMGPTGCGKTKLSIDLASRFFPSTEIINSDKIQIYRGLDITTNKIPLSDRKNIPHHLLGQLDPCGPHPDFTPSDFRSSASKIISRIHSRRKTPFLVGGSNSFIYALLANRFDPDQLDNASIESNPNSSLSSLCTELRYQCCFISVDVSSPVLNEYLGRRVDDMLASGMLDELSEYLKNNIVSRRVSRHVGLNKAIGVPEFAGYFDGTTSYGEAVREVKENTWRLARRQAGKIRRLREGAGWEMERVDATAAIAAAMGGEGEEAAEVWEKEVVEPSVKIVKRFLME